MLPVAHWTTRKRRSATSGRRGGLGERLALEELVEPGRTHLAPDPGLPVAAERGVGPVIHAAVHAHRPRADPAGDAERALAVAAEDGAGQPVDRVVRHAHGVVVAVVREHDE